MIYLAVIACILFTCAALGWAWLTGSTRAAMRWERSQEAIAEVRARTRKNLAALEDHIDKTSHPMIINHTFNPDFEVVFSEFNDKKFGVLGQIHVKYKGTAIALFKQEIKVNIHGENVHTNDPFGESEEYIRVYGYMAEHRRQWNLGNRINWSDDLFVTI